MQLMLDGRTLVESETIRILLVDDHPMFLDGLQAVLEGQDDLQVVGRAYTGAEALAVVADLDPDVVVLDYKLDSEIPGMDGVGVLNGLKAGGIQRKVLFVSMFNNVHYVIRAMECGAHGFVTKGGNSQELIDAVRTVFEGGEYVSSPLDEQLKQYGPLSTKRTGIHKLSPREFELLRHLGAGLAMLEAANAMGVKETTAATYKTRLKQKLGLNTTHQLIKYAIEQGIVG